MFPHYLLGHAEISRATKIETSFLLAPKTAVSHCRKWQYNIPFRDSIRGLIACDFFLVNPAMSEKRTLFESPPPVSPVADSGSAAEAQSRMYQSRRDVLVDGLRRLGWELEKPKAGMFVWAKVPEPWASQLSTRDFAMMLLDKGDVAVSPGNGFGPAGEGYLRMALARSSYGG